MTTETPLWTTHLSMANWTSATDWDRYLRELESILDDRLAKLDENDPVRRKADLRIGEGHYITGFGALEDTRMLFGSFAKSKISFSIELSKIGRDSFGRPSVNAITFYFPNTFSFGPNIERVVQLFDLTNERMQIFYAYADFQKTLSARKVCGLSWDVSRELLGIFWLTFFGKKYCDFFGKEKLKEIHEATPSPSEGATIRLGPSPGQVEPEHGRNLEKRLGAQSFSAGPANKDRGQYALTLAQLPN